MRTAGRFASVLMAGCLVMLLVGCTTASSDNDDDSSSAPAATTPAAEEQPAGGGTGGWLDDIPAAVPKFEYGTFEKDQSSGAPFGDRTMYSLYYEGVKKEDIQAYGDKLTAAGFTVAPADPNAPDRVSANMTKGSDKFIVSANWQDSGHVDLTVQVGKATE